MTRPPEPNPDHVPRRSALTGSIVVASCASCGLAVTPCTRGGACKFEGHVHLRTRLHKCARLRAAARPAITAPSAEMTSLRHARDIGAGDLILTGGIVVRALAHAHTTRHVARPAVTEIRWAAGTAAGVMLSGPDDLVTVTFAEYPAAVAA